MITLTGAPRLAAILARMNPTNRFSVTNPVTYSAKDARKARAVLEKLLNSPERNEVVSISSPINQVNED